MKALPLFIRSSTRKVLFATFLITFAGVGLTLLLRSSALTPVASFQPEQGTVSSPASVLNDSTAAGNQATSFGSFKNPSGEAMPMGDLPGWKQILTEDFNKNATASTFDSTYASAWCGYAEGTGGKYYKIVSASNGMQHFNMDGIKGAAGSYGPPSTCWRGQYGKYTMRFKVTGASGYGAAVMIWPSSDTWGDGEVDYPEGNFTTTMKLFQHGVGCTDCSANIAFFDTGKLWTAWHTTSVQWTPTGVSYYLDGVLIKTVTTNIPINNHRWTIQMAPTGSSPAPGTFDVDWVSVYAYNP